METSRGAEQRVEILAPSINREVLYVSTVPGRSVLLVKPFDPSLVGLQAQFGRGEDNVAAMAVVHENLREKVLGIRETTRRQFRITVDGEQIITQEATPTVVNKWISWASTSPHEQLITAGEAQEYQYAGKTALEWATVNGEVPEMVVKANNGYFYPATLNDVIVKVKEKAPTFL